MPASYEYHKCKIHLISVGERQRKKVEQVEELADSIDRIGLLNPLVVTRDFALVAGERRLRACEHLGWKEVHIHFVDELDELELQSIELEENIKRVDLHWKDECEAVLLLH